MVRSASRRFARQTHGFRLEYIIREGRCSFINAFFDKNFPRRGVSLRNEISNRIATSKNTIHVAYLPDYRPREAPRSPMVTGDRHNGERDRTETHDRRTPTWKLRHPIDSPEISREFASSLFCRPIRRPRRPGNGGRCSRVID